MSACESRKALEAGCSPRSAIVTVRRPPHARQPATGPTIGGLSFPQFPRRRAAFPQRVQVLLVAQSVHGLPEPAVHPGGQLTLRGQIFHRILFPDRIEAVDEFQHRWLENEETSVDQTTLSG